MDKVVVNGDSTVDTTPFVYVEDGQTLISILKSRCPRDAHMYNIVLMYKNFKHRMSIYTLGPDITTNTWVLQIVRREDGGHEINISAPSMSNENEISVEIKQAFTNSKLIQWDKPFMFSMLDRFVSKMIFEISAFVIGNETRINPCHFYYMDIDEALNLTLSQPSDAGITIKTLDVDLGAEFLQKTWKFATKTTLPLIQDIVKWNPSYGIYMDNKPISGSATSLNGLMAFLYTFNEFRNKSYGLICIKGLIKELAQNGFTPCATVEIKNDAANGLFHKKIGMKISRSADFIFYNGTYF